MEPKFSPLELSDFSILNCNLHFIPPKDGVDPKELFSKYPLDLDYAISAEGDNIKLFIKAMINWTESPLEGYKIFAEGVAFFKLPLSVEMRQIDRAVLSNYSTISIALNSLRGFISALTGHAPFGKYTLPSVDVNDLFNQKLEFFEKKTGKKQIVSQAGPGKPIPGKPLIAKVSKRKK